MNNIHNTQKQSPRANILAHMGNKPKVDDTCFIADGACIIGNVILHKNVNIWFNAVIRGDINSIEIGEGTNVQDNSVIHVAEGNRSVTVGKNVTIGHLAMIHGCTIEDNCLIGMHATVMDNAVIGKGSIIGAGAVVTQGTQIPPYSLVLGAPAKVVKQLSDKQEQQLIDHAKNYAGYTNNYNFKDM